MLRITVTTFGSPVVIQDPRPTNNFGTEQVSYTVPPSTTKNLDISWQQLERVATQLEALAAQGLITFTIEPSAAPVFAQQLDNPDVPTIDYASENSLVKTGDTVNVVGPNLNGGNMATTTIESDDGAGHVVVNAFPGNDGNTYDIEIVDTGSGGITLVMATVAGRHVITIDLGGATTETVTTIAALINNAASDTYGLVFATVTGTSTKVIKTVRALVALIGGTGVGFTATLAGIACIVTRIVTTVPSAVVVSLVTPDYSSLSLPAGAPINLQIRANGKVATATMLAAA
jgi:hypothetical protein